MALAPKLRLSLAVVVVVVGIAAAIAGAYALSLHAIRNSNQQWCTALTVLTRQKQTPPANPGANPSREESYLLYSDLVDLKHRFGC